MKSKEFINGERQREKRYEKVKETLVKIVDYTDVQRWLQHP